MAEPIVGSEYLLEVRAEEIPARMLEPAIRELGSRLFEELMGRGVAPREVETGSTPRRLVVILRGLPAKEPDSEQEVVGPPVRVAYGADGQPTPALLGFAKRLGVDVAALRRVATDKGEYVAAQERRLGRPMNEVLAELVPRLVAGLGWAKTMVWGAGHGPWARPVHGLLSLLDGEVVACALFGIQAGRTTVGHPVLSPAAFDVRSVADYLAQLAARGVLIRPAERSDALAAGMAAAAAAHGGTLVADPPLLAKLAAICEIPGVLAGSFDPAYLELPREVLITSLRDHQSAFTVERDGALLPLFLTVMDRPDDPIGRVRSGNEWVVEARLADARFFFREDGKRSLEERRSDLANLTFHAELGSYAEKTARLEGLGGWLATALGAAAAGPQVAAAARLLKVDLTTEMVKEFTSLQGVMGGLYARQQGQPEPVWQAIYDQYLPASADDPLPRGETGRLVGLADRLDTLVGMFGLGLVPSGSRDPFGLRRAAQGVVRILLEGRLALDLEAAIAEAARLYGERLKRPLAEIQGNLRPFFADRVRYLLGLSGYAYDEIEAVLASGPAPLPDVAARVAALHAVREEKEFLSLVLSAKRIANIVKDAPVAELAAAALSEAAERDLAAALGARAPALAAAAEQGDWESYLRCSAELAAPLDRFFLEVMVMVDDESVRRNRIALLQAVAAAIGRAARLTEVVVDRAEHRARHGE